MHWSRGRQEVPPSDTRKACTGGGTVRSDLGDLGGGSSCLDSTCHNDARRLPAHAQPHSRDRDTFGLLLPIGPLYLLLKGAIRGTNDDRAGR